MKAVVIEKPGVINITTVPDPAPGPTDVVVRVRACGICGTDLHIVKGEFPPTPYPIIPGHEFSGEIVAIGSRVREVLGRDSERLKEGTRVAVDPSLFCGYCEFCRKGRGNLCANWGAIGDTQNGAFAEYVSVPAKNVYVLPDNLSDREGALVEPLACAVHGIHRLAPRAGDTILIVGAGTMGLLLLQLALRSGASRVGVVDLHPQRLDRAKKLGATYVAQAVDQILQEEKQGFDCVIDATGVVQAIESALKAIKRGGKFLVFGVAPSDATIPVSPFRIYNEEITILGSMAVLFSFPQAIDLMKSGVINTDLILTHAFSLGDFPQALDTVRRGEGIKVQILP